MRITLPGSSALLLFGIPLSLVLFLFLLTRTMAFQENAAILSKVIVLDLLITLPVVYFLLIRKRNIPKISVASIFVLGMIIGSFIIPVEHQTFLRQIKLVAIPLVELVIISFVLYSAYRTYRNFTKEQQQTADFFTTLKHACKEGFPAKVGQILATEIAVIYYTFFTWRKKAISPSSYTYHRKSGIITVVYALFFIVAIETFVAHFLIQKWNPTIAWVLTALSIYTCVQIFALTRSMYRRPIELDKANGLLHLRYGFFNEATIPLGAIERIELNRKSLPEDKSIVQFSPLGILDTHNTIIHLKSEHSMSRIYGFQKKYQALALYLDEKEKFVQDIKRIINQDAV